MRTIFALAITAILLLCTLTVNAQEYVAIKISWQPNPVEEDVRWYEVQFKKGEDWQKIADTDAVEYYTSLTAIGAPPPDPGINYCFRLIAHRGNEHSSPSDESCISVPLQPPAVPPPVSALSAPVVPTLEWVN